MSLSAGEQYLLELINRARLDPVSEATRYNLDLNAGLDGGTIGTKALQVLAPNKALESAATKHSTWMLNTDNFSHAGVQGANAGDRIQDNGYVFKGSWEWRENLAWAGSTGNIDMEAAILQHHAGLYRSESHRINTFEANISEVGVGQVAGRFEYSGTNYNSSMLTLNYAKSGTEVFVTGVAYTDSDKDLFYSIGEGEGGIWVRGGGSRATTADTGGYGLGLSGKDTAVVTIGRGEVTYGSLEVDLTDGNAKVDLLIKDNGAKLLMLSSSADLGSGLNNARLLGVANLDLKGSVASNLMIGNDGNNIMRSFGGGDKIWAGGGTDFLAGGHGADTLYGGWGNDTVYGGNHGDFLQGNQGRDRLYGGNGHDTLKGGNNNDRLDGGRGNDKLTGGWGEDNFIFNAGRDRITDFQDNIDTIYIREELGLGGTLTLSEVMNLGEIRNDRAIFDFGDNDVLTIEGISNLNMLANDIFII